MRRVTTITCCIAFMISGIIMAIQKEDPTSDNNGYKTIAAATSYQNTILPRMIPKGLETDFTFQSVRDTVYITKTDTIKEQVTKVKWKKVSVPSPIVKTKVIKTRDTIQVPVYYLTKQIGSKEEPTDKCVSVYEVHKVNEICPEDINSSAKCVNERNGSMGVE